MIVRHTRSQLQALPKEKLIEIILKLQDSLANLDARIQRLEGQRHKDSHNSHIPSSQSSQPGKNSQEPSGKEPGGQPGHPGSTLKLVDHPHHTLTCQVTRCRRCGQDLS